MALDASIYGAIRMPEQRNQLAALADAYQLQALQGQAEDRAFARQDRNRLRSLLETGGQGADLESALTRGGFLKEAGEYSKNRSENAKREADTAKAQFEVASKRQDYLGSSLRFIMDNPSLEAVQSNVANLVTNGILPPEQGQRVLDGFSKLTTPDAIRAFAEQGYRATLSAKDQLLNVQTRNTGGSTDTIAVDPVTGRTNVVNSVANTVSPDARLSADTSRANNAATVGATIRGQNLTDGRARELNDIQRQAQRTQVVETPEGVLLVDKGTGQARPAMQGTQQVPGKPSEAARKELLSINQQRSIINGALSEVDKTPGAFSFGRGVAGGVTGGESIAGRFETPAETQARAYVYNNVSRVINERAGAAQSAQELARLNGFLPASTDNAEQIKNKLKAFNQYLGDLEAGTRGTPRTASSASGNGDIDALLKKYGGK